MQATDLIQKILTKRGLSQTALADLLGIDRSVVTRYMSGGAEPGPIACLVFAALSPEDGKAWIARSGIAGNQLTLIAEALGATEIDVLGGDETALIAWWRDPKNPMEESVKSVVEKLLEARTP